MEEEEEEEEREKKLVRNNFIYNWVNFRTGIFGR